MELNALTIIHCLPSNAALFSLSNETECFSLKPSVTISRCCFSGSWTRWCRQVGCGHSCPSCASRSYFGGHYKASPVAFRGKAIAGTDAADMPFVISNIASSDRRRRVVYAVAWLRLDWTQLGAVGCCRTQLAAEIEVYGP
ncbi:uncharacterized protein LOC119387769 isoform X2 [Rhipicephalus sanguineus]|uniref:uncharacterized protein LOC119387769 isoform X2 n=1 Tax=Rhipicephalus sanguineus TaxID=34632 RepID=UPI001893A0F9|nr:uncharacterized protein LOC119387769 isoform X2 [Rhipicephalus sanguineus]